MTNEIKMAIDTDTIKYDEESLKTKIENLQELHKLVGNSVYLIELLRHNKLSSNQFMSPLFSDDAVLKKFPKTYLIVS